MSKKNNSLHLIINDNNTPKKNKEEQSIESNTNYDSLHNTKKSQRKNFNIDNKNNGKNNFFLALKTLRISIDNDNFNEFDIFNEINEYSETNPNQTKEENVSKYIHRPLVKEIIKKGNEINVIKPLTQFGTSINNPYIFNYNLGNLIDKFKYNNTDHNLVKKDKNDDTLFNNIDKNINNNTTAMNKYKFKRYFKENNKKNNNNDFINLSSGNNLFLTNIKSSIKIIHDLEEPADIKLKDYQNKINIIKKNQKLEQINKNKQNINYELKKDNLKEVVKNLNFQDISKIKEKDKPNICNSKDSGCASRIKNMLLSKINRSTGEKIRKKFERSEFKKKKNFQVTDYAKKKNILIDLNENKENINFNNIEVTKKIIKKINEISTVKADYSNNQVIEINNNNILLNYFKKRENLNYSTKSKKNIAKNLLGVFNSCSKKLNFDDSSANIDSQSLKNLNNLSFQEIIDLFSSQSGFSESEVIEGNKKTIILKETDKKKNILKDNSSLFISNILNSNKNNNSFRNNSIKKELNNLNSNQKISKYLTQKNSPNKLNKRNLLKDTKNNKYVYQSPSDKKIRRFDLDSPFNNDNIYSNDFSEYNFPQYFKTDIKFKNWNRSQEIMKNIIKNNFRGGLLNLSESPSIINTQSPMSLNKPIIRIEQIDINNSNLNSNNNNNFVKSDIISQNKSNILSRLDESMHINTIYDISFYLNLVKQSNSYPKINMKIFFKNHPTIKWNDRLNILLWMMKNCEEFAYKRDTFHYSIYYFDLFLYLSKEEIKKKDLKLIGITCISLGAKLEEVQIPQLIEYSKSIDPNCKDINIIISMEQKICSALKWKLIPITLEIWLNWYTCQWDLFLDSSPEIKSQLLNFIKEDNLIYFKKQSELAYSNYRRIYQLIDLISLDYYNYNYDKRGLVAACFFECICNEYNLNYSFDKKKLYSKDKKRTEEFIKIIQKMYNLFVEQSFDFLFNSQLVQNCIRYVFQFNKFCFTYNMPLIYKANQKIDEDIEYNYEDFISYQTTNSDIYLFFENIYKNKKKKIRRKEGKKNNNKK